MHKILPLGYLANQQLCRTPMIRLGIASLFINANRLKAAARKRRLSRRLATPAGIRRRRLRVDPWKFCHLVFSCKTEKAIRLSRVPAIRDGLKTLNVSLPVSERLPEGLWNDRSSPLFCICGGKRLHVIFVGPGRKVTGLHNKREQIRGMLESVVQSNLFVFSGKLALCTAAAEKTKEYLITNLVLTKPAGVCPKLPNDIIPYAEVLLRRDLRRHLESVGAAKKLVDSLEVRIDRLEDRPRSLETDSGEKAVMLPRVTIKANVDIAGPFFAGFLNAIGYGRVTAKHQQRYMAKGAY